MADQDDDIIVVQDETALKHKFAIELLKNPQNPYKAALEIFTDNDTSKALKASRHWVNDPIVLQYQKDYLKENGDEGFLPTKGDVGRKVFAIYESDQSTNKEKLESLKFYSQLMNYVDSGEGKVTVNQNNQKIMVVANYGDDAEWEKRVAEQQKKLMGSRDE